MYYVLFTWIKGKQERDFQGFQTKPELIDFLGRNFERIMIWNIHEAATEYRFGLYEKETAEEKAIAEIKEREEESDEEKPADYLGSLKPAEQKAAVEEEAEKEEKRRERWQHPYVKNKEKEPSAMEKIADDIEAEQKEDLTDAEIIAQNKKALKKMIKAPTIEQTLSRGKKAIEAAEKEQSEKKTGWRICSKCNINRISPINKSGICSPCQLKRKTDRPYKRRMKF